MLCFSCKPYRRQLPDAFSVSARHSWSHNSDTPCCRHLTPPICPDPYASDVTNSACISAIIVTFWELTCWLRSRMSRLCAASPRERTASLPSGNMWCGTVKRQKSKNMLSVLKCCFNRSLPLDVTFYTVKEAHEVQLCRVVQVLWRISTQGCLKLTPPRCLHLHLLKYLGIEY